MDDSNLMLVFFDTFSHGAKPEVQVDSIRFSQPVKIGLIRIVPFGIAIESEIDSEARLGVTNPQSFNLKFFAHINHELSSFEKIGELDFDEKNGVNSISFPAMPLASILAISGCYNMLSIAIFGIISPHALNPIKNSSTPISNQSGQSMPMFGMNTTSMYGSNPIGIRTILGHTNTLNISHINPPMPSSNMNTNNPILMPMGLISNQPPMSMEPDSVTNMTVAKESVQIKEESQVEANKSDQAIGLYEDGEIQEIDYEDVSSNEDLLFGMDDDIDLMGVDSEEFGRQGDVAIQSVINGTTTTAVKKISTGFPDLDKRLMTERWRFLPKRIVIQGQLVSELKVIPNSCKTLFQVELDRLCREEKEYSVIKVGSAREMVGPSTKFDVLKLEAVDHQISAVTTDDPNNMAEDIPDAADRLINLVSIYNENNMNSEWVEEMERLPKTIASGLAYLTYADKDTADYVIDTLATWANIGISMEAALRQSENMYILRHIKAGITLAGYMCSLDTSVADKVLATDEFGINIQHALFDLLESKMIATPLKLLLIRALDLSTRLQTGLDRFTTVYRRNVGIGDKQHQDKRSPYQRLVYFLMRKNTARVVMACSRLISKVHFYEMLVNFDRNVKKLKDSNVVDNDSTKAECNVLLQEIIRYFIHAKDLIANPRRSMPCSNLFDDYLHKSHNPYPNLLHMMDSTNVLVNLDWILSQWTTNSSQDQIKTENEIQSKQLTNAGLRLIWEMAQRHESLVYLMTSPHGTTQLILKRLFGVSTDNNGVDNTNDQNEHQQHWLDLGIELAFKLEALHFIDELFSWSTKHGGLAGLARDPQLLEDAKLAGVLLGLAKLTGERRGAAWIAQVITMDDNLAPILPLFEALEKKTLEEDDRDPDGNTDCCQSGNEKTRVPLPHSICLHYLPNLLTAILRHAENAEYLGKYGVRLAALGKDTINSPFSEARDWLQPLCDLPTSSPLEVDCISHLTEHLKAAVTEVDAATIPPALITVLRLLKLHMVPKVAAKPHYLPDKDSEMSDEQYALPTSHSVDVIRYKYAITEFYHHDGLGLLYKLIQQISDHHQLSWQCGIEPIDNRYPLLLCVAEPATSIIRAVTQRLIEARRYHFKDTTGLLSLFSCYTVFCSGLSAEHQISSACYMNQIESIRHCIIDTVLAYTQSQLPDEESEKARAAALDKSLWTSMLKELLNFTLSAPYAFAGGLTLFIELLPLPLPIQSRQQLSENETKKIRSARTLWNAHILCVRKELKELIYTIGSSSNYTLMTLLGRLIHLISALGPSAGLMIAQSSLEILLEVWDRACKDMDAHNEQVHKIITSEQTDDPDLKNNGAKHNDETAMKENLVATGSANNNSNNPSLLRSESFLTIDSKVRLYPDSLELTRAWAMVRIVLSVPACKHSFLKLLGQKPITDGVDYEHFETSFFRLVAEFLEANKENHSVTQEHMITCLQVLLDARYTMLSGLHYSQTLDEDIFEANIDISSSTKRLLTSQEMINALPTRSQTLKIVHWLAHHCVNPDQDMATIPGALRTLVILVSHDYGFRILLEVLEEEQGMFLSLIKRVNETFSADNPDCQVSLLTALSLLQSLVIKQDPTSDDHSLCRLPIRTLNLSDSYVKRMLQWTGNKEANSAHPVSELHGLLKIVSEEEESLNILRDGMESLIELLSKNDLIPGNVDGIEGTAETMPYPQTLENMYEGRGVWYITDEQLHCHSAIDSFSEWLGPVTVSDREPPELSRCDLENLAYVCCSGFNLHDELARGRQQDDEAIRHKKRRRGHDAIIHTARSNKKFVAPMRGRGFGVRSSNAVTSGSDRHDSFRSRPPNTSRPPSMHVDDFQKLQKDEKLEEEIMIRERNLRSLRGGRAGIRSINHGSRTGLGSSSIQKSSSSGDQCRMPPPSAGSSNRLRQSK